MNRMSLIILAAILAASLLLAGCGSQDNKAVNSESGKSKVNIGVIQIIEHPSLDAARQGFLDVLEQVQKTVASLCGLETDAVVVTLDGMR